MSNVTHITMSASWSVTLYIPKSDTERWGKNITLTCICPTLEEAVRITREAYPTSTIYTVAHQGSRPVLIYV